MAKSWSYAAGEKGRNRVRVYEEGPGGPLFLEWWESGKRKRKALKHRDRKRAKEQADRFAAEWTGPQQADATTLESLIENYCRAVATGGERGRRRRLRAADRFRLFFNAQEPSRRMERKPSTLDRTDWDRFMEWRTVGRIPGWPKKAGAEQVRADLTFMVAALNWATGQKVDGSPLLAQNPWGGAIRRAQGWPRPKNLNPRRPSMTEPIRAKLIEHCPHWQFAAILRVQRLTGRRNNAVRQVLWSDVDLIAGTVVWRGHKDKVGKELTTPLAAEAVEILRGLPSRGIGDAPVFPAQTDASKPLSKHTLHLWLRMAKRAWLGSIEDEEERRRLAASLQGLGFHAEKRAAVRDPRFRQLPPKIQETLTGTTYEMLRRVYDDVTIEDQRDALAAVGWD